MEHIAVFASGNGSNAENIVQYFINHSFIKVSLFVTNNEDAYVLERAKMHNIPYAIIQKNDWNDEVKIFSLLNLYNINFIVLAGFLLKIPTFLIDKYPQRIVNIHPALLPKYGGKGMYGMLVHKTVLNNKENESGISIHYVNDHYDEGAIIAQFKCPIDVNETPETLAHKVHALEYAHFPKVIEKAISNI